MQFGISFQHPAFTLQFLQKLPSLGCSLLFKIVSQLYTFTVFNRENIF